MASLADTGTGRLGWRLSWTAVIAGALLAIAVHVVLGLVGAALGLAAAPSDSKALGAGAAAWAILTPFVASLLGAWLACRMSGAADKETAYLHGILVWCIGLVAGALFLTGTLASGAMTAGTAASGNARVVERATRGDAAATSGQRAARDARARSEDAARDAAATTAGAALASLAGLLGAIVGSGLTMRRGRGRGWKLGFERRHEAHAAAGGVVTERRETYAPPGSGARPGEAGAPPPVDPYQH
jgi:hypothetical protein